MATDPTRIFIPQLARVWLAPVGTVAPDGPKVVMPDGWFDTGLFTPDSLQWATEPDFGEVQSHQSNYPTRRFQTSDSATLQVDLQEWSEANFRAVFGGGEFEIVTPTGQGATPYYRFTPPAIGSRDTVAACIEVRDNDRYLRRIIPRCEQSEGVTQSFSRTSESTLPLRLTVLGGDIGAAWYDISNIPSMAPAA